MVLTFTKYNKLILLVFKIYFILVFHSFFFTFYNLHISFLSVKFSMLHLTETW